MFPISFTAQDWQSDPDMFAEIIPAPTNKLCVDNVFSSSLAERLIWVSGLCSSPFATIARYPYNKYYHVFSALVESSTLAPLIIVYKPPRKLRLKNFYYILLDCFLAVLDVHVK